ncbi:MAG: polysaccharide biosynthesis tyrosine autokinase [Desulfobacterales bacterium]|jgi:capsular exopolysaccharide synthesis family protein|nr:polysaccharide biosynthesis tyrosine autokinase [Desulfobacterales bacterium]
MEEKEIHLRDYLRIVNRRKTTVLTFFIITFLAVVIATFTATPIYQATTKVMMERDVSSPLAGNYSYLPYDPEFLETQYQVITSMAVAEKVVGILDPDKVYHAFFKEGRGGKSIIALIAGWFNTQYSAFKEIVGIQKLLSTAEADLDQETDAPLSKTEEIARSVQAGISVSPVANSRVVEISYMSENPALAVKVANSVAQAYINNLLDMRMEVSNYSIKWMTKKAETQREKLEKSEKVLQAYLRSQDIVTVEDKIALIPERLSELSRRLTNAETEQKELKAVYDQILSTGSGALEAIPVIAENEAVDAINKQILKAEQNISDLLKKYGRKHPILISAMDELKGLRSKKHAEMQKAVQTIKNRYQLAKSNVGDLQALLEQTKFEAANLNEKYIQLGILKREVETNRSLYDALMRKLKERDITEENQTVNVWVIEEAALPKIPAKPNKKRNILLATILGLFGGVGLAFFLEYLDNTVKSPEDIEEKFDIPVIGAISLFKGMDETIVNSILAESTPIVSEGFKSLRTSIFLSSADKPPGSLVVTSMSPGEGKSSICACLAATIARAGKKTLLIDADMRRPVQHQNFKLNNTTGLSSFLAGIETKNIIENGPVENLHVITAGPVPPNPSELLSSDRMGKLIAKLSDVYDMILVDSPPALNVSDPLIISKNVQGVVIVSWAGSTTYEMISKGLKLFKEISVPLIGMILNRFDAKKSGYYYGYGDYYYSSSSKPKDDEE